MAEGVDYSFSRPDPARVRAAGKTFVCRYVANEPRDANMTPDEVRQLHAPGSGRWGWQTRAWSVRHGAVQWSPKAHIRQFDLGQAGQGLAAFGGFVDLDRSTTTDFGQWPNEEDIVPALSDPEQRELLQLLRKLDARSVETFKDICGEGRLREAVFAARALVGAEGGEEIDNAIAAGRDARANFKTVVQGAIIDGLREPSPDHPHRGDLREPFKELLREVLDQTGVDGSPANPPG